LHVNLVFFFSLVSAIPTLLVAVFASFLFQWGVQFWFSDDRRGILENANELARGYYDESQRDVGNNALAMAGDLRSFLQEWTVTDPRFIEQYGLQVYGRELSESAILLQAPDGALRVAAIVDPSEDETRERVSADTLRRLQAGEPVVVIPSQVRTEAVTPIGGASGVYLYIARDANEFAFRQWERAQTVVQSYEVLGRQGRTLQLQFNLALFGVSLALVGLSVWFALRFADRQVKPLAEIVTAAREVGAGNYALRVTGRTGPDEIGLLNRAFNRMTAQIERQTDALLGANRQLAERRAFIEAVLQSITAGIVSVDLDGRIVLMNNSAQQLLLDKAGPAPIGWWWAR
jgi:two-component system nitrogen regulation sensor histidine kinase NtrY